MGAQAMEMAKPMANAAKEKAIATASVVQIKATEAKAAALQAVNKSEAKDPAAVSDVDSGDETGAESESEGLLTDMQDQCNCFPNLSKKQRIQAAVGCYASGALFSFLATLLMFGGPRHVKGFAFFYTLGNICSISSSMFLTGFKKQLTVMCLPIRRVACCIWISTMILTLVVAVTMSKPGLLVLLLVFIQYCAMLWYGASYVPYGRALLKKMCAKAASSASNAV
ncbi:hypothetical protein DYB28_006401 [Aphanomyces astaci]|nr:hypothetical protein DYB25_006774 [Aphanomyces astaci]RHY22619.1 hypothetical protein DYB36_001297 [Aphanomyces astaci]RHY39322.1 hypothetical protein DYB34_003992 [Aphanomyces astaci]RHY58479.1 hypothetical protein DYB38_000489 [Aphanomyces astaci]RHY60213.1 hypothetical protein DYB30_003316 [Aphanomyces astaci]